MCVYGAECSSQAVKRRWILQENPVAPGPRVSAAGSACSSGQQQHGATCDTEPGPGFKGLCWAPASPQHCQEPLQLCLCHSTGGRALHSCLWCQHLEQTHLDHTCVTERPLAYIGLFFGWKAMIVQLHLKAVALQCLTATYMHISMDIDTTTS